MKKRVFSAKQLKAQRAFARMAKARAKAAKAAKRGRRNVEMGFYSGGTFHPIRASKDYSATAAHETPSARSRSAKRGAAIRGIRRRMKNPVSVVKNGRRLYGAAAKAVLAKRGKNPRRATAKKTVNPRRRGVLLTSRTKNGIFRTAARRAISRRLHAPIRFRRRRNSGTPADIQEMHKMFLGRDSTHVVEITAPEGTPKDVAVLGGLVCLKTEDEEFDFEKGEAFLGADGRGNLYVLGDTTPVETNTNFGHLEEIRYEARKDHLNPFRWRRRGKRNSALIEYYHYFGEEDGHMPKLKSDDDGLLHITGGNYTIEPEGITN